jgi:UDP-2-acetamido-3-amino-2,3-dideoxy-glucuronate N-acetyltransferase
VRKGRRRKGASPRLHASAVVERGAELGLDVVVGAFCLIASGARIGAGTRLQSHTSVWAGVELGEDVFVGPAVTFTNVRHPRVRYPRAPNWDRTFVGDGATLGARSVIVAPASIGPHAMVGAGAVVTGDVPAHAVVVGVPARVVGFACVCGETLTRRLAPPKRAVCKHCRTAYVRDGKGLLAEDP